MAFEEYADGKGHNIGRLMFYLYPRHFDFDVAKFMGDGETIMDQTEKTVWAKYDWDENDVPMFDFYNRFEYLNENAVEETKRLAEREKMMIAIREGKTEELNFNDSYHKENDNDL